MDLRAIARKAATRITPYVQSDRCNRGDALAEMVVPSSDVVCSLNPVQPWRRGRCNVSRIQWCDNVSSFLSRDEEAGVATGKREGSPGTFLLVLDLKHHVKVSTQ